MKFIFALGLCLLGAVAGAPAEEKEVDLDTWKAPVDIQKNFPYFHSGYSKDNHPIWIMEVGSYPIKDYVDKGPETIKTMEMYFSQMSQRIQKSVTSKDPNNKKADTIIDFEGLDFKAFANIKTIGIIMGIVDKLKPPENHEDGTAVLVNVSPVVETLLNVGRTAFGEALAKVTIFGTRKNQWIPKLIKLFPADQLPDYYGGKKNFKPVKVYG